MATKTAKQKRAEAKVQYDAFFEACPSRKLLERISSKWVTLILCALGGTHPPIGGAGASLPTYDPRPMRFAELARQVAGVSQKMLTQTLRALERDGLVKRTVTPSVPVTVSYELTELGLSLVHAVRHLKRWAEMHMDEVEAHRGEHGAAQGRGSG